MMTVLVRTDEESEDDQVVYSPWGGSEWRILLGLARVVLDTFKDSVPAFHALIRPPTFRLVIALEQQMFR